MKRRFLLVFVAMVMMFTLVACGKNEVENNSAEAEDGENILRVGMEAAYPPFNWTQKDDSNGAIPIQGSPEFANGYDVQMARKVAEAMGKDLVVVKIEWDGLVPALTSGKIDMIMAGMSPTAERALQIDFTDAYYNSDLVLVVNSEGDYADASSLADFNGAKVVAQLNTFHDTVVDQIVGVDHMTAMSDFSAMRVAVQSGKADAYVAEKPEGLASEKAGINLKMIELSDGFEASPEDTSIAIGLVKGSEMLEKFNDILDEISEDERVELMEKMNDLQGE